MPEWRDTACLSGVTGRYELQQSVANVFGFRLFLSSNVLCARPIEKCQYKYLNYSVSDSRLSDVYMVTAKNKTSSSFSFSLRLVCSKCVGSSFKRNCVLRQWESETLKYIINHKIIKIH